MRRRLQRHVVGAVHGDPVVEVDRVHHPAQRADALAVVPAGEPEEPPGVLASAHSSLVTGSASGSPLASVSSVSDLAPLLRCAVGVLHAGRDVGDQLGDVVLEHDQHLLGHVDLDVRGARPGGPARRDGDAILHDLPHLVGDPTLGLRPWSLQDQLLVGPHRLLRTRPEQAVDRAGGETEFGQPLLHRLDVVTGVALADRVVESWS